MKFIDKKSIKLDKIPTLLDKFVVDFTKILQEHSKYVIVSGYVSILFGRSRATEDIDIIVEKMSKNEFYNFYSDLEKNDYWCVNIENKDEMMKMLEDGLAVRFAKKRNIIPNVEFKFVKNSLEKDAIKTSLNVIMPIGKIKISNIELQIAYKEKILKSDKDLEDAKHLETVFKDKINNKLLEKYRRCLSEDVVR
jgi:hypothetical protein